MHQPLPRRALLLTLPALALAACADRVGVRETPIIYRDLARPGAAVDQGVAASMINGHRRNNGLSALAVDQRLTEVARDMALAMARRDDVRASLGQAPLRQRLTQRGYQAAAADENVSAGYRTLAEAFSMWRGSRDHDRVMRLANATHMGIATVHVPTSRFQVYWAMVVARAA